MIKSVAELVKVLRKRGDMYVPGNDYFSMVSYIRGFELGSGSNELFGFKDWIWRKVQHEHTSLVWELAPLLMMNEDVLARGMESRGLSRDENDKAVSILLDNIGEFLDVRTHSVVRP